MKAWNTLLTASLGMLVAAACTVTVSDGESDDAFSDDDLGLDDQQGFDEDDFFSDTEETEPTPTDATDQPTDPQETDVGTDTDPGTATDAGMPMETDVGETDMPMETDGGTPTETDVGETDAGSGPMCEPPTDDLCEQCMAQDCAAAYEACACDPDCQMALDMMRVCFLDKNFEENPPETQQDIDDCADLAMTGTLLGDLGTCVEAPYMGAVDETFSRYPDDGTCTLVCYGLYNTDLGG